MSREQELRTVKRPRKPGQGKPQNPVKGTLNKSDQRGSVRSEKGKS